MERTSATKNERARIHVRSNRLRDDDRAVRRIARSLRRVRGVGPIIVDRTHAVLSVEYDRERVGQGHVRSTIDQALGWDARANDYGPFSGAFIRWAPLLVRPLAALLMAVV